MRENSEFMWEWGLLLMVRGIIKVRSCSYQERRRYVKVSGDGNIGGER